MLVEPEAGVVRREGRGYIDSFGQGRSCSVPTCATVLSRYNEKDVCWAHEREARSHT